MKTLLVIQKILIWISIALLILIPASSRFVDMDFATKGMLFTISFGAVFLVMIVRPLADIFSGQLWLRRLVILRKGFGILSASIIVSFMLSAAIDSESGLSYLTSFFTTEYYSFSRFALLAHLGDITGLILLVTSNNFSQRLLKQNWKPIQRLAYVYFFSAGLYETLALESSFALYAMLVVANLTMWAWLIKIIRKSDEDTKPKAVVGA